MEICMCGHQYKDHCINSVNKVFCVGCAEPIYKISKDDWNLKKKALKFYWVHTYKRDNLRYLEQVAAEG